MKLALPFAVLLLSVACGSDRNSASQNAAEQLEDAAEVSNPAAAPVMENGADRIREQGGNAADAQNVMDQAANAQNQ